ncbi:MAG: hypothetical protein ACYTGC_02520 [Planctomycetota bacterium]
MALSQGTARGETRPVEASGAAAGEFSSRSAEVVDTSSTMRDPRDRLELGGRPLLCGQPRGRGRQRGRRFLSVWYRCCHAYGRLYPNRRGTAYEGCCPRCGTRVSARIGPHGTNRRTFLAE